MNLEDIDWKNQEWDFYYSDKQFLFITVLTPPMIGGRLEKRGRVTQVKINGKWKTFTERVLKGEVHQSNFEDQVFVGTGKKTREIYLSDDELNRLAITMGRKMGHERRKK
ncbi:hypothetical protein [Gottfriedia solisilvae]|uniref:hypothetical protein n=1 Tax=Gottfriedia solisilvae TaxID=1516104 RepID=UPI003D2F2C2C